jgi:hypothetical protein
MILKVSTFFFRMPFDFKTESYVSLEDETVRKLDKLHFEGIQVRKGMAGTIAIESISVRWISPPPNTDFSYVATVKAGNQTFQSEPVKVENSPFSGHCLTFRQHVIIRLNSTFDVRRGLAIAIASSDGRVQFGTAWCCNPREWSQLSKPRGEVQVIFTHVWDVEAKDAPSAQSPGLGASVRRFERPRSATHAQRPGGERKLSSDSLAGLPHVHHQQVTKDGFLSTGDSYQSTGSSPLIPGLAPYSTTVRKNQNPQQGSQFKGTSAPFLKPCTVYILSIELTGLTAALPGPEASLFFTIEFANQIEETGCKLCTFGRTGYSGCWAERVIELDLPVAVLNRNAVVKLWSGTNTTDGIVVGEVVVSMRQCTENGGVACLVSKLPEVPSATVTMMVQVELHEPHVEGGKGRPVSATVRSAQTARNSRLRSHLEDAMLTSALQEYPQTSSARQASGHVTFAAGVTSPKKLNASNGSPSMFLLGKRPGSAPVTGKAHRPVTEGDPLEDGSRSLDSVDSFLQQPQKPRGLGEGSVTDSGSHSAPSASEKLAIDAQVDLILRSVSVSLENALQSVLNPLNKRLEKLDERLQRNEDALASFFPHPATLSRPSSAESSASIIPTSAGLGKFCVTNEELRERFHAYDVLETGFMTKAQLLHFYRSTYSFASDSSEDSIVAELGRVVKGLEADQVTFDDFCRVALRLAKA